MATDFNPPKTGWWIVMRAPKDKIDISSLQVTPSDYRLVDKGTGQLVKDYPYLVYTVKQDKQRADWFKLPDLIKPYQKLQDAVRDNDFNAAKELISTFKRLALTSDDLLLDDAKRIAQLVKEKAEAAMGGTLTAVGGKKLELPPLKLTRCTTFSLNLPYSPMLASRDHGIFIGIINLKVPSRRPNSKRSAWEPKLKVERWQFTERNSLRITCGVSHVPTAKAD